MSSLYLCRDCSGAFGSLDELQQHEQQVHCAAGVEGEEEDVSEMVDDVQMDENEEDSNMNTKMEEDNMSDADSSNLSNPNELKGRYECEDCHEAFSIKRELATHMRIHSGEQPHMCTQCGKEFGTRQLLKKHWMWHTGQRSHVCPHCNKAFFQKGHLTQHLMIHSGGRPHECQQCHKTFIFKFDLNRHMKIHQERGFSCQQCGRSFLKKVMLDEHFLKCKGKPSSPTRLTPTMKAGLESYTRMNGPSPILSTEQIAKLAQKLIAQNHQQQQQQQQQEHKPQPSAFTSLLIKQDPPPIHHNNNNNIIDFTASLPLPTFPIICMICKNTFNTQTAFAVHTYMHHLANHNTLSIDSTATLLTPSIPQLHNFSKQQQHQQSNSSDADPATDTSCASSPQKASPLPLESSVSPGSSSSSAHSPRPTASEVSVSTQCKDCGSSWQRVQELEQEMAKKKEEFDNYRQMMKTVVSTVSNMLTQSSPENVFVNHANTIFKQLQNAL